MTRCATQISMSQGATWSAELNCKGSETITVEDPAEITNEPGHRRAGVIDW